jgi:hypothetical protein
VPISFNNPRRSQKKVLLAEDFRRKHQEGEGVYHRKQEVEALR